MIEEARRRAYLAAMQVASWLPRVALPFAAPSRPELLAPPEPEKVEPAEAPVIAPRKPEVVAKTVQERPPLPVVTPKVAAKPPVEPASEPVQPRAPAEPPPRFALQLLRAGECALLVELPTGEPLGSRDPAYLLLKDLLRAAGLPDSPQHLGEPVRWPLFANGAMDQGPQAARDFVQGFVAARLEESGPCACLWLVGLPAVRFAGEADAKAFNRELQVDGLGAVWAVPGLESLIEEPSLKAELWRAMRRVRQRWMSRSEA
ncbi:energy transducer TonB [Pseudomonas jinjuensis]|uniref:Energy transducer TonB n=1 Tax=Pseudomonas jinjuensis TaxID=198616 RepID=A0A1H0PW44_9PSED|nr:energy transducer TonB [Pseudomonas jinjuensis]SDP09372.1 hypothetical protein SAMN05216193_12210 [Pseudomonas jinjuensis]